LSLWWQDVAISTKEAEYIALICGVQDAAWLKAILKEFGQDTTSIMITDNDGTRKLLENFGLHRQTKYITIIKEANYAR
jgi:hypothetical protein